MKYSLRLLLALMIVVAVAIAAWQARVRYLRTHVFLSIVSSDGSQVEQLRYRYAVITTDTGIKPIWKPWQIVSGTNAIVLEVPEYCRIHFEANTEGLEKSTEREQRSLLITPALQREIRVRLGENWSLLDRSGPTTVEEVHIRPSSIDDQVMAVFSGYMKDHDGNPIPRFAIHVGCPGDRSKEKYMTVSTQQFTNEEGRFELKCPTNSVFAFDAPGYARTYILHSVQHPSVISSQLETITLERGTRIRGTIKATPQQLEQTSIYLCSNLNKSMNAWNRNDEGLRQFFWRESKADALGEFKFNDVAPGKYQLQMVFKDQLILDRPIAIRPERVEDELILAAFEFPRTGSVHGRLPGEPFTLGVLSTGRGPLRFFRSDHRGDFHLQEVVEGTHSAMPAPIVGPSAFEELLAEYFNSADSQFNVPLSYSGAPKKRFSRPAKDEFYASGGKDLQLDSAPRRPVFKVNCSYIDDWIRQIPISASDKCGRPFHSTRVSSMETFYYADWQPANEMSIQLDLGGMETIYQNFRTRSGIDFPYFELSMRDLVFVRKNSSASVLNSQRLNSFVDDRIRDGFLFFVGEGATMEAMIKPEGWSANPTPSAGPPRIFLPYLDLTQCYIYSPTEGWDVFQPAMNERTCRIENVNLKPGATLRLNFEWDSFATLPIDVRLSHEGGVHMNCRADCNAIRSGAQDLSPLGTFDIQWQITNLWPGKWEVELLGKPPNEELLPLWKEQVTIRSTERIDLKPK